MVPFWLSWAVWQVDGTGIVLSVKVQQQQESREEVSVGTALIVVLVVLCIAGIEVSRRALVGRRLEHAYDVLRPMGPSDTLGTDSATSRGAVHRRQEAHAGAGSRGA